MLTNWLDSWTNRRVRVIQNLHPEWKIVFEYNYSLERLIEKMKTTRYPPIDSAITALILLELELIKIKKTYRFRTTILEIIKF